MADISKINVNNTEYDIKDATARSQNIIEGQASGSIATFSDGGDNIPLKSCEVAIVAQQASGTPSPSNPLPITGFSSVNVGNYAKYHRIIASSLTPQSQNGITITPKADGVFEITGTATGAASINFACDEFTVFSDDTRTININNDFASKAVTIKYNYGSITIDTWTLTSINRTYTNFGLLSGKTIDNITISIASGTTINGTLKTEFLVTNTGTTTPVSLGQTIYGGTAELVGGNGSKTFGYADLGSLSWAYNSGTNRFYSGDLASLIKLPSADTDVVNAKCEQLNVISLNTLLNSAVDNVIACGTTGNISARCTTYGSNAGAFKTAMSGVKFVYELATPTAFTFTGTNIPTLSGVNNVYADSGDIQSLEYFNENADQIADLDRAIDYHNYSTDEHIVGKWIDGSVLYEKTFQCTVPDSGTRSVDTGILSSATVIEIRGVAIGNTDIFSIPCYLSATTTMDINISKMTSTLELNITTTGSWSGLAIDAYVTLRYTKGV